MSRHAAPFADAAADRASVGDGLRALPTLVAATLRRWSERRRSRRALALLTPELLRDIGLDREAALNEAKKPFWLR
ncbi:DUF1127 domain-containing protein [Rubrimonas cliftonensis]|uniref:YjiS-like domain-containing protein n=1 Tax=Rubrimonas cliftonensis TaxID=89524 RepID=A0A1H4DUX9_9RHOB|nr:DUF1127 domain-containing protein [Rubrimonas cliftonensis]SEA76299.1 protein of unknown function [Rubrimonas cliftonensis]